MCRGGRRWSTRCGWDRWDRGLWRGCWRHSLLWLIWDRCDSWDGGFWRGCAGGGGGSRQAGVTGGGIEATSRAGQVPVIEHAPQGFAHEFVVEAGDGGQAPGVHGRGAGVEGAHDALVQEGTIPAGKRREIAVLVGGSRVHVDAQPVEREDALLIGGELEAEDGGLGAQGVFGDEQEALALLVLGVRLEEQAAAHRGQQLERAGFGSGSGRAWSDGAHEQDGAAAALGELRQGGKGLAQVAGAAGVQGVEDEEGGMGAGDGFFQHVQVAGQGEGTLLDGDGGAVDLCDGSEQEHAGGGATGQGMAAGDAGGDVESEQGGAGAGFAFEQGEGAQREVVLPEPGDGLGDDVGEDEARNGGVDGGSGLGLGVRADDAPVFVEAGEDDAAGVRAGVSLVQGFSGVFEVSGTQPALIFLSLEFAFQTHGFPHVCQGFRHGGKGGVDALPGGRFFHGGCSFREDAKRRNERVFLPGDWNEGACQGPRCVVRREGGGQAGEDLSLETASIDSIARGTKWGGVRGRTTARDRPYKEGEIGLPPPPGRPQRSPLHLSTTYDGGDMKSNKQHRYYPE